MGAKAFSKRERETYVIGVDFRTVPLDAGVTVSGGVVEALDTGGVDRAEQVFEDDPQGSGTMLLVRFAADSPPGKYTLRFIAGTSAGDVYEEVKRLTILDD